MGFAVWEMSKYPRAFLFLSLQHHIAETNPTPLAADHLPRTATLAASIFAQWTRHAAKSATLPCVM